MKPESRFVVGAVSAMASNFLGGKIAIELGFQPTNLQLLLWVTAVSLVTVAAGGIGYMTSKEVQKELKEQARLKGTSRRRLFSRRHTA